MTGFRGPVLKLQLLTAPPMSYCRVLSRAVLCCGVLRQVEMCSNGHWDAFEGAADCGFFCARKCSAGQVGLAVKDSCWLNSSICLLQLRLLRPVSMSLRSL